MSAPGYRPPEPVEVVCLRPWGPGETTARVRVEDGVVHLYLTSAPVDTKLRFTLRQLHVLVERATELSGRSW